MEYILLIVLVLLYFIPAFVAAGKHNSGAIFVLNLLLGWTIIGWVGALIWAMTSKATEDETAIVPVVQRGTGEIERIRQLKELRDAGVLSQEEFMEQVSKLP